MALSKFGQESLFSKNPFLIGLILIAVVGAALRISNLNDSLWLDELWSTYQKLGSFRSLAYVAINDVHPPFYSMFMFVWIRIFGDSEIAVRMPSLLFGIGSIGLTYFVGSRLADEKSALLAAFLMSLSPVHIWYSQEARGYSGLVFFLLLAILAQLKMDETGSRSIWSYIYFAAMLFCVLTHFYLAAFLILISFIVIVGRHRNKRQILLMNAVILSALGIFVAAKVVLGKLSTTSGYLRAFTPREFFDLFFNWFTFGNSWKTDQHPQTFLLLQLFYAAIFLFGLVLLVRRSESSPKSHQIILFVFVLPLSLLVMAAFGATNYIERSVLVAMPFFFIVIGRGVTGINWNIARFACLLIVAGFAVSSLVSYFSRQDVWTVYKPKPDWKSAVSYFEGEASRTKYLLTVTPSDELTYYNSSFKQKTTADFDAIQINDDGDAGESFMVYRIRPDQTQSVFDKLNTKGSREFYLVENQYWTGPFNDVFQELIRDDRYEHESVRRFKGLEIHRFKINRRSSTPD